MPTCHRQKHKHNQLFEITLISECDVFSSRVKDCLAEMLSVNSTLERLDVSGNNLGSDYFSRCVGPALMSNKSLKVLKFTSCGSNDVSAICEAMVEGNTTVEELDASNNHIGAVFGEGLLKILQVYVHLCILVVLAY